MADAPERIGRFDYGRGDIRYTSPPLFISGQTNYIRADLVDELVKALGPFVALGNRILSEAPQEAARLAVFTDHEGETHSLEFADLRAAEAALSEKTAERDGAYLTSQQAAQSYSNLMHVKDEIDAQRQTAEAALAKRDEEVARLRETMRAASVYLRKLEDNMLANDADMMLDDCLPPSFHADQIDATLTKEPTNAE